jgi:acyl dehydratase
MVEESLITPALKDLMGQELENEPFEVEKGHIRRFAEAIGDSNPWFRDPEYARKTRFGGIIASPTFMIDISMNRMAYALMDRKPASTGFLNGGIEIEYYQPLRVGDTISSTAKLVDLQEKSSKRGKLLFMFIELGYRNQRNEAVMKVRNTFIAPQNSQEQKHG